MGYRIFVTNPGLGDEALAYLRERGCVVETGAPGDTSAEIARKLAAFQADGLIVRAGEITAEVMDAAPTLRAICKHGVGTNNIDIAAATARRLPVGYTPQANYRAVAEHTLAFILALLRDIPAQDAALRRGTFEKRGYQGVELAGKTLGLVGFGKSARRVVELTRPFELATVVFHPSRTEEELPPRVVKTGSLDEVLARADVVSLHCPLTAATRHLIDARALNLMKRGAYLVNTARGGLVDEGDLLAALQDGRLAGAALDVYETEPLPAGSPLLALPNVVLTPHVAGLSDNSTRAMGMESAGTVLTLLAGEAVPAESLVNGGALA